ncbi:hypothetical protein [Virgisporangium aurantiacum]|uniref:Tat pathway signal sequence domain protein n=1 Tax=Virgisporangium aurantiacum TaxID=175570 RepID=A0A8J3Z009_9ACTN|nr:hypothetical protein [Virgisporangium aurantiacum]GIJ52658.1 hypothetical protein Vau01_001740 [Virgisporangium aurantiacum]
MHIAIPSRRLGGTAVAAGALAATLVGVLLPAPAQAADLVGTIATSPTSGKLAALTAKQVITLTVSGAGVPALSEDNVASVDLGACTAIATYVVQSATVISVKTPNTCAVAAAADIVINFVNGDKLKKTGGVTFVGAPAILATAAERPVINDNSVSIADVTKQARRFSTGGGQVVRIKALSTYAFDPRSTAGLAASMGGKPGTNIKVYADEDGTTPLGTSTAGSVGNSMTFTTASGMVAGDNTVTISQDGVSKSFLVADTGIAIVSAPTVTGLSVPAGRANATNISTVISGTNFPTVLADLKDPAKWSVKFCGVEVAPAGFTASTTTATAMTVTVPDLAAVAVGSGGLGAAVYAGVCPVTVTDVLASQTSPITAASHYTVVNE